MTAIAYRAQRNTTGYYTGYMQKRQPVGAFEFKNESQKGEICKKKFISKERNLLKIECQKGENGCNLNF